MPEAVAEELAQQAESLKFEVPQLCIGFTCFDPYCPCCGRLPSFCTVKTWRSPAHRLLCNFKPSTSGFITCSSLAPLRSLLQGMQAAVARNLVAQLLSLSGALHSVLQQAEDPMPAARGLVAAAATAAEAAAQRAEQAAVQREVQQRPQGKGMAFAFGAPAPAPAAPAAGVAGVAAASAGSGGAQPLQRKALSAAELAAAFRGRVGFTLRVAPSAIAHAEAGDGLWIEGWAPVGQVGPPWAGQVQESGSSDGAAGGSAGWLGQALQDPDSLHMPQMFASARTGVGACHPRELYCSWLHPPKGSLCHGSQYDAEPCTRLHACTIPLNRLWRCTLE